MCDLRCAYAKRQRSNGTVRSRMTVAADNGHSGAGEAEFRADDMDDALRGMRQIEQINPCFPRICGKIGDDLAPRSHIDAGKVSGGGRSIVVSDRGRQFGPAHL